MSKGIGSKWLERHKDDLQHGYLVNDGHRGTIPRAYIKKLEKQHPEWLEELKARKQRHIMRTPSDRNEPDRLAAEEVIHKRRKELTERRTYN